MLKFTIPGEPQGQGRPRFARRGKRVKTYDPEKSRNYKAFVGLIAADAVKAQEWQYAEQPLKLSIVVYLSIAKSKSKKFKKAALDGTERPTKKPDLSNVIKGIEDALNGLVYKDDSQIVELSVKKYYSDVPRVELEVECV